MIALSKRSIPLSQQARSMLCPKFNELGNEAVLTINLVESLLRINN